MNSSEHDNLLFSMLQECKTLPVFLDHVFGFLRRRTDFYVIADGPDSSVGLPPNLAEQFVKQTFFKWKPKETQLEFNQEDSVPPSSVIEEIEFSESATEESTKQQQKYATKPFVETNFFPPSECYNGQVFENYSWSQTLQEVDVFIKIPAGTTSKDLSVTVLPEKLSIKLKNTTVLLDGELCNKCKNLDVIWSINKNKLEVHLDKLKEMWWDCLLRTEPKLDMNKLDCTRPFEELSEEAQAKIEELQWNHERKRLGLPTTEEIKVQKILKESWNAEGSPFSGAFDPSAVKFQ